MKKLMLLAVLSACAALAQNSSCDSGQIASAPITLTTSGNTVVIPAVAGVSVHLCVVALAVSGAVNVTLVATTVGGTNTNLSGAYPLSNASPLVQRFAGGVKTGLGKGFTINLSSAVASGGIVTYYISRSNSWQGRR